METLIFKLVDYLLTENVIFVYIFFFVSTFLQVVFPPYPGDAVLLFQGYLTSISDTFDVFSILVTSVSATLVGSICIYKLGYHKGDLVFNYKLVNRYVSTKHREKARKLLDKYGYYAITASKFIPGVNGVMILLAGILKVKSYIVYISVLLAAAIHNTICVLLGRFLGNNMSYVKKLITTYNGIIAALVIITVILYFVFQCILNKRLKKE